MTVIHGKILRKIQSIGSYRNLTTDGLNAHRTPRNIISSSLSPPSIWSNRLGSSLARSSVIHTIRPFHQLFIHHEKISFHRPHDVITPSWRSSSSSIRRWNDESSFHLPTTTLRQAVVVSAIFFASHVTNHHHRRYHHHHQFHYY